MNTAKPIRYIVINPGQNEFGYSASYNERIPNALTYAKINARQFGGSVFAEYPGQQQYEEIDFRKTRREKV